MSDANSLNSLRCPNCGAPLDYQPGQATIRCRFCDSVIEHSHDALTAADQARAVPAGQPGGTSSSTGRRFIMKIQNGVPVMIEAGSAGATPMMSAAPAWPDSSFSATPVMNMPVYSPTPTPRRSSWLGCLVTVAIIAVVACGILAAVVASSPSASVLVSQLLSGNIQEALGTAGSIGARVLVSQSGVVVNGANDGPPEAIMLTAQYPASSDQRENRIVALNTSTRKLLWQSAPLDPKLYNTPILADAEHVYFMSGQQIMAVNRSDGSTAWQASLADAVELNLCTNCLQLVGTHLVALSNDGTLEAFDAATGQTQWNARAQQDSPRGLYLLGNRVTFMDRNTDIKGVLRAFDVDSGKETKAMPACQASGLDYTAYADWTTTLTVAPDGKDFYIFFGTSPQCAQRWDAQSLKMVWNTPMPEGFSGSLDGLQAVFSGDNLYAANSSDVLVLALGDGTAGPAISDPDYHFNVIGAHGDDVLLVATRQRGTSRDEIWAVNVASGDVHWKYPLEGTQAMRLGDIIDDDTPQWLAQPLADGLHVLRFQSASDNKSYAILQDVLSWDTGKSGGQQRTALHLDTIILQAPDWITWKNNVAWMGMNDELLAFDASQNKITLQWP